MKKQSLLFLLILITLTVQTTVIIGNTTKTDQYIEIIPTTEESKNFWVLDYWKSTNGLDDDNDGLVDFQEEDWDEGIYQITTTLINQSNHFELYLDDSLTIAEEKLQDTLKSLEMKVTVLTSTFGEVPDINNDDHVNIVVTDIRDLAYYGKSTVMVYGFFWPLQSEEKSTEGLRQYSIQEETIYLDYYAIEQNYDIGIAVHELQHLIQYGRHPDQDLWLDEGLSVYSEDISGFSSGPKSYTAEYFDNPFKSLTYFENDLANYGMSYLFVKYLVNRYTSEIINRLVNRPETGMTAIVNAVNNHYETEVTSTDLVVNYSIALTVNDPTIREYDIPSYSSTVITLPLKVDEKFVGKIKSWSFLPLKLEELGNVQGLRYSFEGDPLDTKNNAAVYWLTFIQKQEGRYITKRHFIDPLSAQAEGLFVIDNNSDQEKTILFLNAFSGLSSGTNSQSPPLMDFTLEVKGHNDHFYFPGYIHQKENQLMVTSIRVYTNELVEKTPTNTKISNYELIAFSEDETVPIAKGELLFTESGWLVPTIDLTEIAVGENNKNSYKIKFSFYDGNDTITFCTKKFTLTRTTRETFLLEIDLPLKLLVIICGSLGVGWVITKMITHLEKRRIRELSVDVDQLVAKKHPNLLTEIAENTNKRKFKVRKR